MSEESFDVRDSLFRRRHDSILQPVANPFENDAKWTRYEVFKAVVVGLTLFPIRFVLFLVFLLLHLALCKLATLGFPLEVDRGCHRHGHPMAAWRRLLLAPVVVTNRGILLALGFWWISIKDERKRGEPRPKIVVAAPHLSVPDDFIINWCFPPLPSAVGKKELLDMPLLSAAMVACQGIFVDRKNSDSRLACKEAIAQRASPSWTGPPTLIFPEGTTTNGKVLIQFRLGPFSPHCPVQPVILRYPSKYYDISWVGKNTNPVMILVRMMLQFANYCEIIIPPARQPVGEELKDAMLFADNVRTEMAKRLNIDTTAHSYDDVFFHISATEAGINQDFEVGVLKRKYGISVEEIKRALENFKRFDPEKRGEISHENFLEVIKNDQFLSKMSEASVEHLFSFIDTDQSGSISYREFMQFLGLISGKCSPVSQAKLVFLLYDVNGEGQARTKLLVKGLNNSVAHRERGLSIASEAELTPAHKFLGDYAKQEYIDFETFNRLCDEKPHILKEQLEKVQDRLGVYIDQPAQ